MRPAGLFVLGESEAPIVAFAGGSGITPVISPHQARRLATTQRQISLVYANRDADSVIFADELERLRDLSPGRLSVHHHLDADGGFLDAAGLRAADRRDDGHRRSTSAARPPSWTRSRQPSRSSASHRRSCSSSASPRLVRSPPSPRPRPPRPSRSALTARSHRLPPGRHDPRHSPRVAGCAPPSPARGATAGPAWRSST